MSKARKGWAYALVLHKGKLKLLEYREVPPRKEKR
jgi:hypothetical protein